MLLKNADNIIMFLAQLKNHMISKINSSIVPIIPILVLGFTGCQSLNGQNNLQKSPATFPDGCLQNYYPESQKGLTWVTPKTSNSSKIFRGQKIYVPFYSELYNPSGSNSIKLVGMVSIRNTSETQKIRITRVDYFDSSGELEQKCLKGKNLVLSPMATTEFGINRQDERGRSGAKFIVEWVSEQSVGDPVIEAIIGTDAGTQGFVFVTPGRVIEEFK